MKKTIFLLLQLLFISTLLSSQSIYFNKRIDIFGSWDVCRGIIPYYNGYLVAGVFGDEFDVPHIYLSNIDSVGNLKWSKDYITPTYFYYFGLSGSLFQTKDKNYAICGGRVPPGPKGYGILIKVDSLGNKKWEKEYQLSNYDNVFNSGTITNDGGFILTGDANTGTPHYSYFLLKTDSLGNQQWYKTYTDNYPSRNYAGKCVIQTPDKGYCLSGRGGYWSSQYYYSVCEIIKTDSLGNQQWKKTYGNSLFCNLDPFVCLSKDTSIFAAYCLGYSGLPSDNSQIYITKIDLIGNEKWNKKIGNPTPNNRISWVKTIDDGNFLISGGHFIKDTLNKYVGWLFKIKSNGDSLWYREYEVIHGPIDNNQLWHFTPTKDKGFACAGSLFPNSTGGTQDIWVFKTDSLGCLVPNCTGIGITEFNPNAGAQMLVYPNPFTNAFAINYNIPKENKKSLFQLYDVYRKLVYQTGLSNNVNQLQVVAASLKSGMYVGCLVVDGLQVSSQKILKE